MSLGNGILQGLQIAKGIMAPWDEDRLNKERMAQELEMFNLKNEAEQKAKQNEFDMNRQNALAFFNSSKPQQPKTPQVNIPQQLAVNPVTGRQQLATPEALARAGEDPNQYAGMQKFEDLGMINPSQNQSNYMDTTTGKVDESRYSKDLNEYNTQQQQFKKNQGLTTGLPKYAQGDLSLLMGDKGFGKEYGNTNKALKQIATYRQMFPEELKNISDERLFDMDPQFLLRMADNKAKTEDRKATAKEQAEARFEYSKQLKEIGLSNSKELKAYAQQFKKSSEKGSGSKDYGTGLFQDEFGEPVKYYVDKYGRPTKKALEPYANPTKTPNPNRKPLAPYKSNPIPKSNIGR